MASIPRLPDDILLEILGKLPGDLEGLFTLFKFEEACGKPFEIKQSNRLYERYKDYLCKEFPKGKNCKKTIEKLLDLIAFRDKLGLRLELTLLEIYRSDSLFIALGGVREIPKEIGRLKNLRKLSIWANKLKKLPKEIGLLKNLEILYAWDNLLEELPKEIGSLKNLRELDVEGNELKKLPKEIGSLKNLRKLNVRKNCLEKIPREIVQLESLIELKLGGNPSYQ